jgi:rhomboid protease GluP
MTTRNSLLCPGCGKLVSRSAERCPFCNIPSPGGRFKSSLLVGGFKSPDQLIVTLISINVAMFVFSLLLDPRLTDFRPNPLSFLSPGNQSLLILGSTGTIPIFQLDRWWTLLAANYLHGSILHLAFNMLALRQLAPLVIGEYGMYRMIVLYTAGGAAGFFLSALAGVRFTIGASAALCSLIGALLYYGKSRGGNYGQAMFSQIGSWALGIVLFGFMVPGINNWGHGGGMVAWLLLGYLLGYLEKNRETFRDKFYALACVALTALVLVWSLVNGFLYLAVRFL